MEHYQFSKSFVKGLKSFILFSVGIVVSFLFSQFPEIANLSVVEAIGKLALLIPASFGSLTIGALSMMAYDFIKRRWISNLP